jgi:hypothetical protein
MHACGSSQQRTSEPISKQTPSTMSHLLVYATTDSRLHADLVIVRLKRAGISMAAISILHPQSLRPNSAVCWINGSAFLPLPSGEGIAVSGSLSRPFNEDLKKNESTPFSDRLCRMGLSREQGASLEDSLLENRIVIAIEVHDEYELPAIYHTLRGMAVQKVNLADIARHGPGIPARSGKYRPLFAPAAFAMAYCRAA